MHDLKHTIYRSPGFSEFIAPAAKDKTTQVTGLTGSLRAVFLAFLVEQHHKQLLFVSSDHDSAERMHDDLLLQLDHNLVSFFPASEVTPYEDQHNNPSLTRLRLEAQYNLINNTQGVVVATHQGLMQRMQSAENFVDQQFHLSRLATYNFDQLISGLVAAGYERCDVVEDVGHIAVRGGIIDIYPWTNDDPVRMEFFGNQIESIRTFNVVSQRSIEEIEEINILPGQEGDRLVSLFEYLNKDTLCIIENPGMLKEHAQQYQEKIDQTYQSASQVRVLPHTPQERYLTAQELETALHNYPRIYIDLVHNSNAKQYRINSTAPPTFAGHLGRFFAYLKQQAQEKNAVHIQCDSQPQKDRIEEILEEEGLEDLATITVGALHNGFICKDENLHVLTDHELYDRFKKRRTYKRFRNGEYLRSLNALNVDDYVVHIDYGIGQYKGLETIDSGSSRRECIKLMYQDGDSLFVSVDRLNRVQKYASDGDVIPKLTRLRSGEWERIKTKTKESIQKIAGELLQLNAARKYNKGYGFPADTHWQKELEASFPYEETDDQMRSIVEVKQDLENDAPMDRLLCGDVGYGKTEVALRAAFKVVMDGKQAALLVPTTILAYQHFQTFSERMSKFPIQIAMLSRFRTAKQQREVINKLTEGKIDIVIGTHRLLSEDVKFKELGLLIIDEEQRFGVKHKERLKQMRVMVDVLTMSATPIPRTLHLALMGARDLSHIETPPRNRLPVITEIHEWDDQLIRNAINREMERGGQVYFVHNRVNTIDGVHHILSEIVPHARIAVAHGQLPEKQLEAIMMDFIHKKYDVLVSTMIIENGLDIPNVNTIIIDHAHRFGLAQLYQLRGRVGRAAEQAFAYLIIRSGAQLTGLAQKRLRAIQDFTDLGSGFKVALRDMEIRGIGNILGKEQSGNMQAVGFDLYCKLLEESVASMKSQAEVTQDEIPTERQTDPKLDVDFDLMIPSDYIFSEVERITVYHRMVNFRNLDDLEKMKSELKDRFGPVPDALIRMIDAIELKILAGKYLASRLTIKNNMLRIDFDDEAKEDDYFFKHILPPLMNEKRYNVRFLGDADKLGIQLPLSGTDRTAQLDYAKNVLNSIN